MLGSIVIVTGLRFIWFRRSRKTGNQCAAGTYGAGADFPQSLCGINAVKRKTTADPAVISLLYHGEETTFPSKGLVRIKPRPSTAVVV